jgi:hypothetical protein
VALLALHAAQRSRLGLQALERDVNAAIEAKPIAANGDAPSRGFQRAQLA